MWVGFGARAGGREGVGREEGGSTVSVGRVLRCPRGRGVDLARREQGVLGAGRRWFAQGAQLCAGAPARVRGPDTEACGMHGRHANLDKDAFLDPFQGPFAPRAAVLGRDILADLEQHVAGVLCGGRGARQKTHERARNHGHTFQRRALAGALGWGGQTQGARARCCSMCGRGVLVYWECVCVCGGGRREEGNGPAQRRRWRRFLLLPSSRVCWTARGAVPGPLAGRPGANRRR